MATFSQLLSRFKAEQSLGQRLSQADLGIAVEEEKQDINKARADYQLQVEKAEREMAKKARKRGRGKLVSQIVGTAVGLGTGNPMLGAKIAAGGTLATGPAVGSYDDFVSSNLQGGRFFKQGRADFEADINATNQFISDASEGQTLLDLTDALSAGFSAYSMGQAFGDEALEFLRSSDRPFFSDLYNTRQIASGDISSLIPDV